MKAMPRSIACAAAVALLLSAAPAAAKERSQIPDKYKWNLADLFPSEEAWARARADLAKRIPRLAEHRGHLGDSAELLRGAGVDMTTSAPFDAAIAEMNATMDEIETVLARGGGQEKAR